MRSATKLVLFIVSFSVIAKEKKSPPPSPIEDYVAAARANLATGEASPGSLYIPGARFSDLARDVRASQIGDLVTILVSDQASAVSRGATSSSRKSSANRSTTDLPQVLPSCLWAMRWPMSQYSAINSLFTVLNAWY